MKVKINESIYQVLALSNTVGTTIRNYLGVPINKVQLKKINKNLLIDKFKNYEKVKYYWSNAVRTKDFVSKKDVHSARMGRISLGQEQKPFSEYVDQRNECYKNRIENTYFNLQRDNVYSKKGVYSGLDLFSTFEPNHALRIAQAVFTVALESKNNLSAGMCQEYSACAYSLLRRIIPNHMANVSWLYNIKMNHYYCIVSINNQSKDFSSIKYSRLFNHNYRTLYTNYLTNVLGEFEAPLDWTELSGDEQKFNSFEHIVVDPWISEISPNAVLLKHSIYRKLRNDLVGRNTIVLKSKLSKSTTRDVYDEIISQKTPSLELDQIFQIFGGENKKMMLGSAHLKDLNLSHQQYEHNINKIFNAEGLYIIDRILAGSKLPGFYSDSTILHHDYIRSGVFYEL